MIILDTNVISELMKQEPSKGVIEWLDAHSSAGFYVTSITLAEIEYGLQVLPLSQKRRALERAFHESIQEAFKDRVLDFDGRAALEYGALMAHRKRLGKPLSLLDGQIAAIVLRENATLATRNIRDFIHCKIELMNPFE